MARIGSIGWPMVLAIPLATRIFVNAASSVSVVGNAFFLDSSRFYVRGLLYDIRLASSPTVGVDVLADQNVCGRDVSEFKKLGINTVYVKLVDTKLDSSARDECMAKLSDSGIYVIVDLTGGAGQQQLNPSRLEETYNQTYLEDIYDIVDTYAKYDNTLAFFAGDGVLDPSVDDFLDAAPYVKATVRDTKQYISSKDYRSIPVGYAATNDNINNLKKLADYLNAGPEEERIDFMGLNNNNWCVVTNPSYTKVYAIFGSTFEALGIPMIWSQLGCPGNDDDFSQIGTLSLSDMTRSFSGAIIKQYVGDGIDEDYSLVSINGASVEELARFTALSSMLDTYPAPTDNGDFQAVGATAAWPSSAAGWTIGTGLPPEPTSSSPSTTSGSSETTGTDGSPRSTSDVTQSNQNSSESSLSTATKAGIGIGVGLVVLILIVTTLLLLRRRRRNRAKAAELARQARPMQEAIGRQELHGSDTAHAGQFEWYKPELDPDLQIHEADGIQRTELDTTHGLQYQEHR